MYGILLPIFTHNSLSLFLISVKISTFWSQISMGFNTDYNMYQLCDWGPALFVCFRTFKIKIIIVAY